MLIADCERALQKTLQKAAKEIEKKGINIIYKTEFMVKKMLSSKFKLQIRDTQIKLVLKFKYLGIEDGQGDICPPI